MTREYYQTSLVHSTSHQLARVYKYVDTNLKNKHSVVLIALDILKAFDSVWHDGLTYKLIQYDCPGHLTCIIDLLTHLLGTGPLLLNLGIQNLVIIVFHSVSLMVVSCPLVCTTYKFLTFPKIKTVYSHYLQTTQHSRRALGSSKQLKLD